MDISSIMSQQLASLQHTVSMSLMKNAMSVGAAQAIVMLDDFQETQQSIQQVAHPYAGKVVDVKV
ncbi:MULTISPECIES: hypothetical protein [Bacillus]|uniref:hypothetical protein n=1 Tax=Bacillus TaxID=1386 RepID=UPI0002E21B68|nr:MULTISPECIES: hypothetical protein [Bacillus]